MMSFGRFFFMIPAPFVVAAFIGAFGLVANPPQPAKTTTINCLSITKGDEVAPGKFEYTCELRKD